jgi:hypothetical protein
MIMDGNGIQDWTCGKLNELLALVLSSYCYGRHAEVCSHKGLLAEGMMTNIGKPGVLICQGLALLCFIVATPATAQSIFSPKPYRVLLVVEQWGDPYGVVVKSDGDEFQPVAALLKAWSVPFDILQLDEQHLDASYLFDRLGSVRYGAVIWLADPASYAGQDLASLQQAANNGTSLIVIRSRVRDPLLNRLLGVEFLQFYTSNDEFHLVHPHYVVHESTKGSFPSQNRDYSVRPWMTARAEVLVAQGEHPVITVNQLKPGVSAIWLGTPDLARICDSVFWRDVLLRSLVWSLGYLVVPDTDYAHRVILELDDWGTADKGFLSYWHYLEPNAQMIREDLIQPLEQHNAIASAMVDTGYVDRQTRRIVSPWTRDFTDSFGLHQDYKSTLKGLEEAVAAGVIEIESHGWTHMEPDLESPPGPWWTADLAGGGSVDGWYSEFQDRLRDKEVPTATQLYHMERSLEEIRQDFGVDPLELKPGGDAWSKSRFNNTAGLAARVSFGLFHGDTSTYYLDRERVLDLANVVPDADTGYDILATLHPEKWQYHPDGPVILGFHDRDISLDHNFIRELFAALPPGYRTMGTDEYVGILHTQITSSAGGNHLQFTFEQDPHYCTYFKKHPSAWRLWLSGPLREQLSSSRWQLSIDDQPAKIVEAEFSGEFLTIYLPSGTGAHTWKLETAGESAR